MSSSQADIIILSDGEAEKHQVIQTAFPIARQHRDHPGHSNGAGASLGSGGDPEPEPEPLHDEFIPEDIVVVQPTRKRKRTMEEIYRIIPRDNPYWMRDAQCWPDCMCWFCEVTEGYVAMAD